MADDRFRRKLAAILAVDVVGYSRLMAADEAGTLSRLKALRREIIDPAIAAHGGRLVKLMGDGALVEFASVTEAVACATEIQARVEAAGEGEAPDRRIRLRIGINLGEVMIDGEDLYGDGVNVAARLEGLADPGGVALSGAAYDQARGRVAARFDFAGQQQVKNIPQPVRVYHLRGGVPPAGRRGWWRGLVAVGAAMLALAALAGWWLAGGDGTGDPARRATDRPSIVVLPFDNLSGSPEQAYFTDGITESIITDLSRVSGLLVIARNTSFTFKDQAVDVRAVAGELGVRYVVEGSVQKAGARVRINANLIDADTGYNLWAEKLDRDASDLFALQDEVTGQIIAALQIELTEAERRAVAARYTDSLAAYDLFLRAWERYWQYNEQARREARAYLTQALAEDPGFARAEALMAMTYTSQVGASLDPSGAELDRAYALAQHAVALDDGLPQVHWVLGLVQMFRHDYDRAEASVGRAIALDPNFADAYALLAWILQYAGQPDRALEVIETAFRLNPRPPFPYLSAQAETYFSLGRYEDAAAVSAQAIRRNPTGQRLRLFYAASLAMLGRMDEAEWQVQELLLLDPGLTLAVASDVAPYRDAGITARLAEALKQAGLPG